MRPKANPPASSDRIGVTTVRSTSVYVLDVKAREAARTRLTLVLLKVPLPELRPGDARDRRGHSGRCAALEGSMQFGYRQTRGSLLGAASKRRLTPLSSIPTPRVRETSKASSTAAWCPADISWALSAECL